MGDPKETTEAASPELAEAPSAVLAAEIATKLVQAGLISAGDRERLERSLAKGSADATEWELQIGNAIERENDASK